MLHLMGHGPKLKCMMELKNTPGLTQDNLVMTSPKQKQVGQHRNAYGVLTSLLVSAHLVLAQPQSRFEFPVDELNRPTLLVHAHHLSRCQLQQIGHQNLGLFWAQVTASIIESATLYTRHLSNR